MNQADVSKLISQLRIRVAPRHRNLKNPDGPAGRHLKLRKTVTGLIKYERIELNWNRADEARGYAERLISDAIRHGDTHRSTMQMADYWILEKPLVHKLFKVLAPRFAKCSTSYTRLIKTSMHVGDQYPRAVLELRGHPYPPLFVDVAKNKNLIHNVLLDEAKKEYRAKKYAEMAERLREDENKAEVQAQAAEAVESTVAAAFESAEAVESTKVMEATETAASEHAESSQAAPTEMTAAEADSNAEPSEDQRTPPEEHKEDTAVPESEKKK